MSKLVIVDIDELKDLLKELIPKPQEPKKPLMTAQEISDEFGIPKKTLDHLRQERIVSYYRYSKEYRYDRESLERYIDSTIVKAR